MFTKAAELFGIYPWNFIQDAVFVFHDKISRLFFFSNCFLASLYLKVWTLSGGHFTRYSPKNMIS
jgi:hypothetical protein